jgi:peptidoglycan hydrolase-like protein with peptidoglycan-binding domain
MIPARYRRPFDLWLGFINFGRSIGLENHKENHMKKLPFLVLALFLSLSISVAQNQNANSNSNSNVAANKAPNRKPIFRATADQIKQAQAILKQRGFYGGEQIGKLDTDTRAGLKKYQQAEGLKVTGTLNKKTLEKMGIALTEKQKTM